MKGSRLTTDENSERPTARPPPQSSGPWTKLWPQVVWASFGPQYCVCQPPLQDEESLLSWRGGWQAVGHLVVIGRQHMKLHPNGSGLRCVCVCGMGAIIWWICFSYFDPFEIQILDWSKDRFKVRLVSVARRPAATFPYIVFTSRGPEIIFHSENDHNVTERILLLLETRSSYPSPTKCWEMSPALTHLYSLPDIDAPKSLSRHTWYFALPWKCMHNMLTSLNTSETICQHC